MMLLDNINICLFSFSGCGIVIVQMLLNPVIVQMLFNPLKIQDKNIWKYSNIWSMSGRLGTCHSVTGYLPFSDRAPAI